MMKKSQLNFGCHLKQFWLHLVHTLVAIQQLNNKIEKKEYHGK
jgi:hypothetical protein